MSGLTVGYLSIDDLVLELKLTTGTEEEKEYAKKIGVPSYMIPRNAEEVNNSIKIN